MISHPEGTVGSDTACCFEYKDYWQALILLAFSSGNTGGERYCHNADRMERRAWQTERMHELFEFVRVNATALGYVAEAASRWVVLR